MKLKNLYVFFFLHLFSWALSDCSQVDSKYKCGSGQLFLSNPIHSLQNAEMVFSCFSYCFPLIMFNLNDYRS